MASKLENAGLSFIGKDESGKRMEILELPTHPYYVGVQFHPEFKSRPGRPSPLFFGLIKAACRQLDAWLQSSTSVSKKLLMPRNITDKIVAKPKRFQNGNVKIPLNGKY